jgi:mono/diheme cytochrome c family protein
MPSFGDLTPFERWALVAYVKQLSVNKLADGREIKHFELRPAKTRMEMPKAPPASFYDPAKAAKLYKSEIGCFRCHGAEGLGDGPSAEDMEDSLGFPIKPANLQRGEVTFKAGHTVEDIYRIMTTGMAGTPMPAFSTISDEERWQLAYYVQTLYKPIDPGERVYLRVGCTSCHTIGKGKLIGPDLTGVTQRRTREWLQKWLKDPPGMIATDETARKLMEEFLTPMPSYGLTRKEVDLLIEYMGTLPPAKPVTQDK